MPCSEIITKVINKVMVIQFNRPNKKNAFNENMYFEVAELLNSSASDGSIIATVLTGVGDFYSSGNDFVQTAGLLSYKIKTAEQVVLVLEEMITAIINYPKLLIAVVNGPAIGIAATTLGLCDIVYASELAYFQTPFVNISVCAEGCSSENFPRLLGRSKTSEMIFLGKKLSVQEAHRLGFISEIVPVKKLDNFIEKLTEKCGKMSLNALKINKKLINMNFQDNFLKCSRREMTQLIMCLEMKECQDMLASFATKKGNKGHKL